MQKWTLFNCAGLMATVVAALLQHQKAVAAFRPEPKSAAAQVYIVDKTASEIKFQVKSRLKVIEGLFENWKAQIDLDPARLEALQLRVQAQSASIKTGNAFEEALIRGENFFAAEKYPEVSVVSKKITSEDAGRFRMEAELTLRGTTHPVVIPFVLEKKGESDVQLRGEFEFNRKDFGISFNMALNPIEDMVRVIVTLKAREQGQPPKEPSTKK
jgi:polyisoprenoid-binding protein YceI